MRSKTAWSLLNYNFFPIALWCSKLERMNRCSLTAVKLLLMKGTMERSVLPTMQKQHHFQFNCTEQREEERRLTKRQMQGRKGEKIGPQGLPSECRAAFGECVQAYATVPGDSGSKSKDQNQKNIAMSIPIDGGPCFMERNSNKNMVSNFNFFPHYIYCTVTVGVCTCPPPPRGGLGASISSSKGWSIATRPFFLTWRPYQPGSF